MTGSRIAILLFVAATVVGCAWEHDLGGGGDRGGEGGGMSDGAVRFSASIGGGRGIRTTADGDEWAAGDKIGVFMMRTSGEMSRRAGPLAENVKYVATKEGAEDILAPDDEPVYWPSGVGAVDFAAYYPWRETPADNSYIYKVSVEDQSSPDAIDLLWTRTDGVSVDGTGRPVVLKFVHVMSKITFNVTLEELESGSVTAVTLAGMPVAAELDIASGSLGSASCDGKTIEALQLPATNGATDTFTAIVVPQPEGGVGRTVTFRVGETDHVWNISPDERFEAGRHYVYPVTVTAFTPPPPPPPPLPPPPPPTEPEPEPGDPDTKPKEPEPVTVGPAVITGWKVTSHAPGTPVEYFVGETILDDGTPGEVVINEIPGVGSGTMYAMSFGGDGTQLVSWATFGGTKIPIGRRSNEIVTLKFDETGKVVLRTPVEVDGGDGTDIPIPIGTFAELALVGDNLDGDYIQEGDIDLMNMDWKPIGEYATKFTGSYDGGGHTIANLRIVENDLIHVGLFGYVGPGGRVSNVGIVSGEVTGKSNVGAVCGNNHGTIVACYNVGAVVSGTGNVGGVCGVNENGGVVIACRNTGDVSGTNGVGGVCGANNAVVTACYNSGTVTGTGQEIGGVGGTGSGGSFVACYNTGEVSGAKDFGSVCGFNLVGAITACYYLDRGIAVVGTNYGDPADAVAFGPGVWPDGSGEWTVDGAGDGTGGHWRELGGWAGGGSPDGSESAFPRLWWEPL